MLDHHDDLTVLPVPEWLALAWRAALIIIAVLDLGAMYVFFRQPWVPAQRKILMSALAVVTLRFLDVNALEHWHHVVLLEGLPVDTVWLILAGLGLRSWVREGPPHHNGRSVP